MDNCLPARLPARLPACPTCRYIAALLERLPTLASIQLTDYMGLVDPLDTAAAGAAGVPPAQGAKPATAAALGGGAGKEAGGGGVASRAGTPGLGLQQAAEAVRGSLPGWRRRVAESPVPGGISQYDLSWQR